MIRMRFEKTGSGVWISHLDLMKVLQRAFRRAGVQLRHTEGFNPHAYVSIALPLSVGSESCCELLEFAPEQQDVDLGTLPERLNAVLPAGVRCLEAYRGERKLKELVWLRTQTVLEYDRGLPEGLTESLRELFRRKPIVVEKRAKSGIVETDISPLLHSLEVRAESGQTAVLDAVVRAQNPPLNPALLVKAIETYLPALAPDFSKSRRLAVYTAELQEFR